MSNNICGIILNVKHGFTKGKEINFCGKSSLEWLKIALDNDLCGVVDFQEPQNDFLNSIKPLINITRKYTAVLYSDTPLVTNSTLELILHTLVHNKLPAINLGRGWVFETEFLIKLDRLPKLLPLNICENDFSVVNNFVQVERVTRILNDRILDYHMNNGVHIMDKNSTHVDCEVQIAVGTTIHPNNILKNNTEIKDNVILKEGNTIDNSIIDSGAIIHNSVINDSYVGKNTTVGPYARLRPDSIIGNKCKIGNFVEIKNSLIGDGTKVSHHTYIGDAQVGVNCNFGCGVVVANYDGVHKNPTKIGSNVFVGANSTLIAPIVLEHKSYVAAGSTLTKPVPQGNLGIARARQENKPNYIPKAYRNMQRDTQNRSE